MISRLYGVLLPFFVSFLLAYMLAPVVDFVQYKCRVKNRTLSVFITLLVVVGLLTGLVCIMVPVIGNQAKAAGAGLENYVANLDVDRFLSPETQERIHVWAQNVNMEQMLSYPEVRETVNTMLPKLMSWVSGGLSWLAELVVVFIGLLYLVFLLIDFPRLKANWSKAVPKRFRPMAVTLMRDIMANMNAYFRGQALVAAIVGVLFAIGFSIIGMPMGIAMGLIIGVLNMVPYMQGLSIPPCIILCLVQSAQTGRPVWVTLLCMALVFIIVQSLQDFVIVPKVMGKVTGLSPVGILLSLSIWGAIFGVIGMIIALPMTTLGVSYYKHYILKQSKTEKL